MFWTVKTGTFWYSDDGDDSSIIKTIGWRKEDNKENSYIFHEVVFISKTSCGYNIDNPLGANNQVLKQGLLIEGY